MAGSQIANVKTKNIHRKNIQHAYNFDGIEICQKAFFNIYKFGEKRWRNLKSHFSENDIKLKTHNLKGKKPHNAFFLM